MMPVVLRLVGRLLLIAWLLAGLFVVFVALSGETHVGHWIVALICASIGVALPALLLSDLRRTGRLRRIRRPPAHEGHARKQRPWRSITAALVVGCWLLLGLGAVWIVWSGADTLNGCIIALGVTNAAAVIPALLLWGIARPHQPPQLDGQRFARSPMWTLVATTLAILWMFMAQLIIPLSWLFLAEIPGLWARGDRLMAVLLTLAAPGMLSMLPFSLWAFHAHIVTTWRWRRAPFAIVSADQVWLNGLLLARPVTPLGYRSTRIGSMLNLQHAGKRQRIPVFALATADEKPLLAALQ